MTYFSCTIFLILKLLQFYVVYFFFDKGTCTDFYYFFLVSFCMDVFVCAFILLVFNWKIDYSQGDYSFSGLGVKTHSTDFSSGKSDSKYYPCF